MKSLKFKSYSLRYRRSRKLRCRSINKSWSWNLVLVDNDTVCISNLNRQIHATTKTVDMVKVEAMKERIKLINPECKVEAKQVFVTAENIQT